MKKIITPAVREISEDICDVTGQPAVATLKMYFGYGSVRDGDVLEVDLSSTPPNKFLRCCNPNTRTFSRWNAGFELPWRRTLPLSLAG